MVTEQLGRRPRSVFAVVVRDSDGRPAVIRNAPRLEDGTPMPTLYWLTSLELIRRIGHLESAGGVDRAESEVDALDLAEAHRRYAEERDELLGEAEAGDRRPRPSGGVAGTRRGVKCLHAHYAWFLAGGDDPVGRWVCRELAEAERPES